MPDPRAYFEIDRAGVGHEQWIWRVKRWEDHVVLASSALHDSREAAMREAAVVRDDIGQNQGIWDQTVEPESTGCACRPFPLNRTCPARHKSLHLMD